MTKSFPPEWVEKTIQLNERRDIKRGDLVIDRDRHKGVVVGVEIPDNPTVEDHGTVTVWQSERFNYGDDNCEHYTWLNWKRTLRILDQ